VRPRGAHAACDPWRRHQGVSREAPRGEPFDTRDYAGIVEYEPTELVITARAGTPLARSSRRWRRPGRCSPSSRRDSAGATLGGAIATGLSGRVARMRVPRATSCWCAHRRRAGDDLTFGGRVMKNVAGFDVARLMTGAMGTLGVITRCR